MSIRALLLPAIAMSMLAGCSSSKLPPLETVPEVDLERFMGDWYVIASIPTWIERAAFNAVESYRLEADGTIATTFSFRQGGFDGEEKVYNPRGFIRDRESNAVWGMQFIWPIKADYRIVYIDDDYSQTIIGRNKRDYVWIMAREPSIPEAEYDKLVSLIQSVGYDTSLIRRVPQQWQGEE